MPIPVLLLVRALTSGGSERQMTELAKSLDRRQWEPHVGCFDDEGLRATELKAAGIPIVRLPVSSFKSPAALWHGGRVFREYVSRHGIQIVHAFDVPTNLFGVAAGWFFRCPVVISSQRAHRSLTGPFQRRLLRLTDRLSDGIVVNCEAVRKHLVEDEGVQPDRIHLCYNGLDVARFSDRERKPTPALSGASLVIGCLCVLRPEKGLATLIESFAAVRRLAPGIRLVLVGSGPMLSDLRDQAARLGVAEAVHFQPATGNVAEWLHAIDIFVLPSLSEALSNSLMEAMLCGCCAVASRVGGNGELVVEGQTGMTFEAGNAEALSDCLRRLIENEELRKRLAAAGKRWIEERFSVEQCVVRMGEIYSRLLAV
jgi:glycosyltransferase involved in cell wall biosynthesis